MKSVVIWFRTVKLFVFIQATWIQVGRLTINSLNQPIIFVSARSVIIVVVSEKFPHKVLRSAAELTLFARII